MRCLEVKWAGDKYNLCFRDRLFEDMNGSKDGNDQLLRAFEESFQSQSFLPLLKEELKCKIQCRRLSKGEGEMKVQFEEQKVYQVKLIISINSMEKKNPQKTTCFGFFYNYFFYSCQNLSKSKAFWYHKKTQLQPTFLMGKFNQNSTK